ncbi:MAG TPA: restriction endonuclease subunit S [Gammaproteobacteria bacterium]|nr:restriction endonuclease subunit S [Gammaproteobacteria bacterium]
MNISIVTLGRYVSIVGGYAFKSEEYSDQGCPIIRISNIHDGVVDISSAARIPLNKSVNAERFKVKSGDLLMAMSGATTGKLGLVPEINEDVYLNQRVANFKITDSSKLDSNYLRFFLGSPNCQQQIWNYAVGVAQPNISSAQLEALEIPLPPKVIQKKIAQILETADNLRKKCRQIGQELNVLAQSLFLEIFGDPILNPRGYATGTIRDIVASVNYGTSAKASEGKGQYPILRMNNLTYEGYWNFASLKYINLEEREKEKYLAKKGDLLFNRTNSKELVGKTAVFREEQEMAIAGYLIRVRCNESANSEYVSAYLNSSHGKATLEHMCKSIVGMANINAQELQDIQILLPPKNLQDQYAEFIHALLLRKKLCLEQEKEVDALFNTLIQENFNGELSFKSLEKIIKIKSQAGHV